MGSNFNRRQKYIWRWLGREAHEERECRSPLNIRSGRVRNVSVVLLSHDLWGPRCLGLYPRACLSLSEPINIIKRPLNFLVLSRLFYGRYCRQRLDQIRYDVILLEDTNWINTVEDTRWWKRSRTCGYNLTLYLIETVLRVNLSPTWELICIGSVRLIGLEVGRWRKGRNEWRWFSYHPSEAITV